MKTNTQHMLHTYETHQASNDRAVDCHLSILSKQRNNFNKQA